MKSKGECYARIFRKAGALLAKGNVARAVAVLKEGRDIAERSGDRTMVGLFEAEIERVTAASQE